MPHGDWNGITTETINREDIDSIAVLHQKRGEIIPWENNGLDSQRQEIPTVQALGVWKIDRRRRRTNCG